MLQESGPNALGIVTLINFLVGLIIAFVGAVQLEKFGASIYVADLVAIATVRELAPIMTGIIMAGRTGSGFAAELGTMQVNQEIEALSTMAVPPMDFLVLPRLLALSLMMPLLCLLRRPDRHAGRRGGRDRHAGPGTQAVLGGNQRRPSDWSTSGSASARACSSASWWRSPAACAA